MIICLCLIVEGQTSESMYKSSCQLCNSLMANVYLVLDFLCYSFMLDEDYLLFHSCILKDLNSFLPVI